MSKRQYSDEQKAETLAILEANNGNLSKTSRETGIPPSTLRSWRDGDGVNPSVAKIRDVKKGELAERFEGIAHTMLDHAAAPKALQGMNAKDAIIAAATATDKMRLLRGLPTEIIAMVPPLVEAIQKRGGDPAQVFETMIQKLHAEAK